MKRRDFLKSVSGIAVGAAVQAPAIWSPAKADARSETLLVVTENGPNNLDIHGVGTNRAGYEVWPGSTSLPVTSTTSRALAGKMSAWTAAILPLRIATSLTPSMPEVGQITRPPRKIRSKLALIDMVALP